jgi:hypothetical protein
MTATYSFIILETAWQMKKHKNIAHFWLLYGSTEHFNIVGNSMADEQQYEENTILVFPWQH